MGKPILKTENLHYSYGEENPALNGVDIAIYEGEKIAVMGSNGSGKSTFFLNLNGVFIPEQGTIHYQEQTISKKNRMELKKHVGIVFQNADDQIIASTVRAEVAFGPMNLKLPKEEVVSRVEEALAYMNISDFVDRPPHYLSGGEKKRVSIADIIAMKSEVIIFDEPTAALDPVNAEMLEEVLQKLNSEGKTILLSTHDVDFAYRWADRILVFCQGKVIADGTPDEIFQQRVILAQANLKQPMLLEIYELLAGKHLFCEQEKYPKSVKEFAHMLKKE